MDAGKCAGKKRGETIAGRVNVTKCEIQQNELGEFRILVDGEQLGYSVGCEFGAGYVPYVFSSRKACEKKIEQFKAEELRRKRAKNWKTL